MTLPAITSTRPVRLPWLQIGLLLIGATIVVFTFTASGYVVTVVGFAAIYGFTSDEKGIRHPLLDDHTAKVDETDALFMIGACAAFVSYLINKARAAGLLGPTPKAR